MFKFPKLHWNSKENQRNFFEGLKLRFQIKEPHDWGKVTVRDVNANGGLSLLNHYFNGSLFEGLQSTYPGNY